MYLLIIGFMGFSHIFDLSAPDRRASGSLSFTLPTRFSTALIIDAARCMRKEVYESIRSFEIGVFIIENHTKILKIWITLFIQK